MSDVSIVLVGDTFVGRSDPDTAFDTARHLFADADIVFCNLETVVANPEYLAPDDHDPHPRTDEWKLASYARAGFNVVNLANNVTMWHGLGPFFRCLDLLDEAGIAHGGGGRTLAEVRGQPTEHFPQTTSARRDSSDYGFRIGTSRPRLQVSRPERQDGHLCWIVGLP